MSDFEFPLTLQLWIVSLQFVRYQVASSAEVESNILIDLGLRHFQHFQNPEFCTVIF